MKLYRPVGFKELDLILNTGNRRFPPRLASQPIFYPVLNKDYATEIARNWNTKDSNSGYAGYVTEFEIEDGYISSFETHQVGASRHIELWIPAEELENFNKYIQQNILIVSAYYGAEYTGKPTINTSLKDRDFKEILIYLCKLRRSSFIDYTCEVLSQWKIITQNYFLWRVTDFSELGISSTEKEELLISIKSVLQKNIKWFIYEP